MKVCVPITVDGQADSRRGRADRSVVAEVADGGISDWQLTVAWGNAHNQGTEGTLARSRRQIRPWPGLAGRADLRRGHARTYLRSAGACRAGA